MHGLGNPVILVLNQPWEWGGLDDMLSGVWEMALIGAATGAMSVIVFWPIIWLKQRRDKREAGEKASRERAARRAFSKVQREDDEKWAREFASRPVPGIGRKPD